MVWLGTKGKNKIQMTCTTQTKWRSSKKYSKKKNVWIIRVYEWYQNTAQVHQSYNESIGPIWHLNDKFTILSIT